MSDWIDELPDRVRVALARMAAHALGELAPDHVPGALKPVAKFAPAKRVQLAGDQVVARLADDAELRERLGVQARVQNPEAAAELDAGSATVAAAALAVLEQPEGWEDLLARTAEAELAGQAVVDAERARAEATRLRERLAGIESEIVERQRRNKAELEKLRRDNAELRRKLGETRAAARAARQEADEARAALTEVQERAEAATSKAEADVRKLRAQLDTLTGEKERQQRTARTSKDTATVRARLLLETLVEASQGLRRELGLPPVEGTPADAVAAELAEEGTRSSDSTRSLRSGDPERVQQLLALPNAHLLIDGYNVTRSAWESSPLELQRNRLLSGLAPLVAQSGAEITVVFDAYNVENRPVVRAPRGVRVLFTRTGQIADDLVRELVDAEPDGRVVGVVTNDQEIVDHVRRKPGVRVVPSEALVAFLTR